MQILMSQLIIKLKTKENYFLILLFKRIGNEQFPVRVQLLVMCRGELSAIIARLMSEKRVEVVVRS